MNLAFLERACLVRLFFAVAIQGLAGVGLVSIPAAEFRAAGPDAASIAATVDAFRARLGGVNNGVATNASVFVTGRREINWDAAGLPVSMPPDFFNRNSRRGAVFFPASGTLDARVSVNSASGPDRLFGDLDPSYPGQFTTNSPNRLFTVLNDTNVEVRFFVPALPTVPGTVSGFGAIFTDVELACSARIECYGVGDVLLGAVCAPVSGNAGLSFAGLAMTDGRRIARVRITSGTAVPGLGVDDTAGRDVVVMDDFIYGEPQPAPASFIATGSTPADIAGAIAAFRAEIGGGNNGVSTNDGPTFPGGRREINWDAAALPVDMPADFFNNNSKRGAVFSTPGTGFRVSANSADDPGRLFGDINSDYANQFTTNSPDRLFVAAGSTKVDATFFVPARPAVPATVSAFGAVFTDVEQPGSMMEFVDINEVSLAVVPIPVSGHRGLSFVGLAFRSERIARVHIVGGTRPLGPSANDGPGADVVAMDDFIYAEPQAAPIVRWMIGSRPSELAETIAAFRADIGGPNNGVATNGGPVLAGGRREINWDAAALPIDMPADFFNSTSKRGAVFSTPGTGFRVSANSATAPERLFGDLNPSYTNQFNTNSPNRLFTALGSTVVDATFFVPSQPAVPATVTAFGAVFTDVELLESTRLECFDLNGQLLATVFGQPEYDAGLSFVGVSFPNGERIARVRIISGTRPLGPQGVDTAELDVVAMDDFIYSEPQAAPLAVTGAGGSADEIGPVLAAFRGAVGGANNGVATAGGPTFSSGRREINWDAAALPVNMPPDFFNATSRRGAVFATPGTGFLVSQNSDSAAERLFGDLNPLYPLEFATNSPNRLFTALGSTIVEARFFVPSQPAMPATVGAFGAVFTDVERAGATRLEFFDVANRPLGAVSAPPSGQAGLSFAGLVFQNGERIARVRIVSGNQPLGPAALDTSELDVVAMDDFIYSEPQSVAPLIVQPSRAPDGSFEARIVALPGLRYTIERNTVVDANSWEPIAAFNGPVTFVDTNTVGQSAGFYRAATARPLP